jgi:hypothetical protein
MNDYNDVIWSSQSSGAPIVTIATYGITFNSSTIDLMNKPKRIKMGYSPNSNKVLVKPTNEQDGKSFEFAAREKKRGYIRIGNKDFVKYIANQSNLPLIKDSIRFPAEWDSQNQLLIVDLNNPIDEKYKDLEKNSINSSLEVENEKDSKNDLE